MFMFLGGTRGLPLTKYLKNNGVKVNAIVDNDIKKQTKESEVSIIPFNEVKKDSKIIISIANSIVCNEIINQIHSSKKNIECIVVNELDIDESMIDIFELYSIEH